MKINEMIEKANIKLAIVDGQDMIRFGSSNITDDDIADIKASKPEIVAELKRRETAKKEREEKIRSIGGLDELEKAIADMEFYHDSYAANFEDENGCCNPVHRPDVSIDDLRAKYPRAAAYIHAESFTFSPNPDKFAAGEKAIEKIINGEDHNTAIKDMEKEWSEAAKKAVMNA